MNEKLVVSGFFVKGRFGGWEVWGGYFDFGA